MGSLTSTEEGLGWDFTDGESVWSRGGVVNLELDEIPGAEGQFVEARRRRTSMRRPSPASSQSMSAASSARLAMVRRPGLAGCRPRQTVPLTEAGLTSCESEPSAVTLRARELRRLFSHDSRIPVILTGWTANDSVKETIFSRLKNPVILIADGSGKATIFSRLWNPRILIGDG